MTLALFGLTLLLAIVHWITVYKHWYKAEFFFKPAVMAALLVAYLSGSPDFASSGWFFVAAILFSMAGDLLLLFPSRFVLGLLLFVLAHIGYIIGFNIPFPHISLPVIALAVLVIVPANWLYRRIRAGLVEKGLHRLRKPVQAYMVILSLMFLSGFATLFRPEWPLTAALLVAGGAALFAASDSLLAWNKFVHPLRTRRVGYMIAYHLGQMAIIAGVLLKGSNF